MINPKKKTQKNILGNTLPPMTGGTGFSINVFTEECWYFKETGLGINSTHTASFPLVPPRRAHSHKPADGNKGVLPAALTPLPRWGSFEVACQKLRSAF